MITPTFYRNYLRSRSRRTAWTLSSSSSSRARLSSAAAVAAGASPVQACLSGGFDWSSHPLQRGLFFVVRLNIV